MTHGNKVVIMIAGLASVTGSVQADITPLAATRGMNISLFLDAPQRDYFQRFDQYQYPTSPLPFGNLNRRVTLHGEPGAIEQQSLASQVSTLMDGQKLVDATLFGSMHPGRWSRGVLANSLSGTRSELIFTARFSRPTEVDVFTRATGEIAGGVSLTADVVISRAGVRAFEFNFTPPSEAVNFDAGASQRLLLAAGDWQFAANVNGTGQGGWAGPRSGAMSLFFGVTTEIPNPAGALCLACAGVYTITRRRR